MIQAITQTPQYMVPIIDMAAAKGFKTLALLAQDIASGNPAEVFRNPAVIDAYLGTGEEVTINA